MQYISKIAWQRDQSMPFSVKTYSRTHQIQFGGGSSIDASSAPEYLGKAELPNPEELFTASVASCFSLTLLYLVAAKGFVIDDYQAEARGTLAKNAEGKMAVTDITIIPSMTFQNNHRPDDSLLNELCHKAHDQCFISSSVKTKVTIEHAAVTTDSTT